MSTERSLCANKVVDREIDVRLVTEKFHELLRRKQLSGQSESSDYRLTICFAPHFYGSGALESSYEDVSKSFLENLKKSAFLYVDLQELEQTPPEDRKRNFKWAIYYMMIKAASDYVVEEAEVPDATFKACHRSSSRLYIVVAFDEIGSLEAKVNKYDFDIHPVAGVRLYNDFFRIIRELCQQDNLFFLVAGKSNGLSIQNHATSVSRVLLIKEHLEKSPTTLPNRPLVSEFVCSASLRVEALADALLEYSGGVSGLLTRAVNFLLNYVKSRKEPLSKEECIELMEDDKFQEFCTKPFQCGLSIRDENTKQALDILLMMALYHIPFTLDSRLPSRASVFDLATEMEFY
eukprot:jgi/Galph1/3990/GphlegSOOS_G2709.1